jgi:hypothetical protein
MAERVLRPINTDESVPPIVVDPSDDGYGSHLSVGAERVLRLLLSDTSDFTDESVPPIVVDPSDDGSGSHLCVGAERVLRLLLSDTSVFPPTIVLASEPSCSPTLDVISSETEEDEPDVHELSHAREYSDSTEELLELLGANGGPTTAVGSALQTSSMASGSGVVVSVPVSGISSVASGSGSACGIGDPSDDRTSDERPAGWSESLGFALGSTFGALGNSASLEDSLGFVNNRLSCPPMDPDLYIRHSHSASVPVSGISSAASGSGSACGIGDPSDDRTSDERPAGWSESLGFALGSTFGGPGNSASLADSLGYIRPRSRSPVRHGRLLSLVGSGGIGGIFPVGIGGLFPVGRGFMEALSGQHRHRQSAFSLTSRADLDRAYEHACARVRTVWRSEKAFYIGITENPSRRFGEHLGSNSSWSCMVVLVEADSSRETADLERRLLKAYGHSLSCTNNSAGGERPSAGSPHYLYMLVAETGLLRRGAVCRDR